MIPLRPDLPTGGRNWPSRRWFCWCAWLLTTSACGPAGNPLRPPPVDKSTAPRVEKSNLFIDPKALNLGEVLDHSAYECKVPIRNDGAVPVEVDQLRTSCECLQASPTQFTLQPGETVDVKLTVNLENRGEPIEKKKTHRSFATGFSFYWQDGMNRGSESVSINATVRDIVSIPKEALRFGRVSTLSQQNHRMEIPLVNCLPTETPIKVSVLEVTSSAWDVQLDPNDAHPSSLRLALVKTLPVGPVEVRVKLLIETPWGKTRKDLTIQGLIVEDISISPKMLTFAPGSIGSIVQDVVRVESLSKRRIRVVELKTTEGTSAKACPTERDSEVEIQIQQTISKPGKQPAAVKFVLLDKTDMPETYELPIWYHGRE